MAKRRDLRGSKPWRGKSTRRRREGPRSRDDHGLAPYRRAAPTLAPADFAHKWQGVTTTERASAQAQFIDICRMLGEPTPHEADPAGEWYAFEKGAEKLGGGDGFADVWKRGHFAWEYKGKRKDLKAAYRQLNDDREDLDNPPLLVVSDLDRFEVHTNFTGTPSRAYRFTLADISS